MTMGWQKLPAFLDNCRVEHCVRKGSGKCRATGHVFQKVTLCDTVLLAVCALHGLKTPSISMLTTMHAARRVLYNLLSLFWDCIQILPITSRSSHRQSTDHLQGEVRFVAAMGKDKPHKTFLTMEAARDAMAPVMAALHNGKWDATSVQVRRSA